MTTPNEVKASHEPSCAMNTLDPHATPDHVIPCTCRPAAFSTLEELEATVREMAAQAARGHKRFCLGYHEHAGGQVEEEWVDWSAPFGRLLATYRSLMADRERLQYVAEHAAVHLDQAGGAIVCDTLDEFRAAIDAASGTRREASSPDPLPDPLTSAGRGDGDNG